MDDLGFGIGNGPKNLENFLLMGPSLSFFDFPGKPAMIIHGNLGFASCFCGNYKR